MSEQEENLARVRERIAPAILAFLKSLTGDRRFYAEELRAWVRTTTGILAPGSADRILRDLRQHHTIDYRVVSRRESLYETLRLPGEEQPAKPPARPLIPDSFLHT